VNRTPEQAARARANPLPPNLETNAAALTRDEIDDTIVEEWSPFVVPGIKRGNWITAMIGDHKVAKHTANALLLYPLLKDHCPRCTHIHDKGHRRFSSEFCALLSAKGPLPGFLACKYVYCSMLPKHARVYYPKINLQCFDCLHRGHVALDKVFKARDAHLTIFEEAANLGFVTRNRFRTEGAASGYYPILTLGQVRHVDNMGGYSRLLAMDVADAERLIDKGARLHTEWVGAEPYYAQVAASRGFLGATGDAANGAKMGDAIMEGTTHRQRRIRPSVNFRQMFCSAEDTGTAWGDQVD
jgi:hypothetical protein